MYSIPIPKIILTYEHIDNLDARFDPASIFGECEETHKAIEQVKELFRERGWEGDGEVKLIWLPPFLDEAHDDSYGDYIWHVKQNNNGTSFLGFQDEWQSAKILDQNPVITKNGKKIYPESCMAGEKLDFLQSSNEKKRQLNQIGKFLTDSKADSSLKNMMLSYIQNDMIAIFSDFINEVYFRLLHHVFMEREHLPINLPKWKVNLDIDILSDSSQEGGNWSTITQIVKESWEKFKFRPFKDRLNDIVKSINYNCDESICKNLIIHNEIRNCFQHHLGELVKEELQKMGISRLLIKQNDGTEKEIPLGRYIELTETEIIELIKLMDSFVIDYENYYKSVIHERTMASTKPSTCEIIKFPDFCLP